MNFDIETQSEDFFSFFVCMCVWGGGGGGGGMGEWRQGGFQTEKKQHNMYSLTFCAHALYKISSS